MERDPLLEGVRLPKKSALAAFFREACPELLQHRKPRPKPPPRSTHVHALWEMDSKGSTRIRGVNSGATAFHKHLQAKVVEVSEAKGSVDNPTNGAIDAFDETLGHPVIEVVEEFMPPVAQRLACTWHR
jgi:hypothetical protein